MPDTTTLSDIGTHVPVVHDALALARQPALPGFLGRAILRIDWLDGVPDAWTLRWVIETCRAELRWSVADYERIDPASRDHDCRYDARHPSEFYRLPHEQAAACVLNAWDHVHPEAHRIRLAILVLRGQSKAAADTSQSEDYRASWAAVAERTTADLRDLIARRRKAWSLFIGAVAAYRAARAEVDGSMREAA